MNNERKISGLSELQHVLITLLAKSNVEGDALIGTVLILKEYATVEETEEWVLWLYHEKPTPEEVNEELIRFVKMKQERGEMPTIELEK